MYLVPNESSGIWYGCKSCIIGVTVNPWQLQRVQLLSPDEQTLVKTLPEAQRTQGIESVTHVLTHLKFPNNHDSPQTGEVGPDKLFLI